MSLVDLIFRYSIEQATFPNVKKQSNDIALRIAPKTIYQQLGAANYYHLDNSGDNYLLVVAAAISNNNRAPSGQAALGYINSWAATRYGIGAAHTAPNATTLASCIYDWEKPVIVGPKMRLSIQDAAHQAGDTHVVNILYYEVSL